MTARKLPNDALGEAIASLEAQRPVLGSAIVDAALAPLLAQQHASHHTAPPRRRQVSVLFLDVVGSTALSQTIDPEDLLDIMDSALQSFSARVAERGGKVLQYAGDSLLAAFGAETAREDDAERAVLAGLDLLAETRLQAARIERTHRQGGFQVRVGVHTGHVLLGGGVDDDGTIRGFTVNIAARLEQTAPPGSLRISQETWRHVRGVFDFEAQPPLQVKGQDEPLRTWLVLRAKPRAFRVATRGIEGSETPLVGRNAELAQLVAAFDGLVQTRNLHAVTLLAEAGLGKSRLIQELQHHLEGRPEPAWLLLGRALPSGTLQPYGLLRDVLAWRLQIADGDSAEVARRRLVDGLAPYLGEHAELQAELLGQLVGMDFSSSPRVAGVLKEPRQLRDRALAAFDRYVQALCEQEGAPVVVMLLDDLQWADDVSLDWLARLLASPQLPMLLVMAGRPELLERRPAWSAGGTAHATTRLSTLGASERQALTTALLHRLPAASPALCALIEKQAEGNPFYAEELVKMLIDDGVILVEGERWRVLDERLSAARIPGTLTGVLQARLDALSAAERRAVQLASVVGPVFWDDALHSLDPSAPSMLRALEQKEMVQAHVQSAFAGTREEAFQHHLLHQVTYDTVLKSDRREAHARTAAWLAARVGDREAEYLAVTAEHYERAGDQVRALDWYERAAAAAEARYANEAAWTYLQRMLAMPELGDSQRRWKAASKQVAVADLIADRVRHRAAIDEEARIADALDDDAMRASVAVSRALLADRLGDRAEAAVHAQRGAELAARSDAAVAGTLAHAELSWLARERGDIALAHHHIALALPLAAQAAREMKSPNDDIYESLLRLVAAQLHASEHDFDRHLQLAEEARVLAEQRGQRRALCSSHESLALWALNVLDTERAARHLDETEAVAREIGQALILASVPLLRARLALIVGDDAATMALALEAEAQQRRIGGRAMLGECLMQRADLLARMGDSAAARELLREAIEIYTGLGDDAEIRACRLRTADVWRGEGRLDQAQALVEAELPFLGEVGALATAQAPLAARMAGWRVLAAAGDARAPRQLELAMSELQQRVAKVGDPEVRRRMLEGLPLHREITAEWQARGSSPPTGMIKARGCR